MTEKEQMPDGTEQIEITAGSVIAAEFLLDSGDLDADGALHQIATQDQRRRSDVSFRPVQPDAEDIVKAYRNEHGE